MDTTTAETRSRTGTFDDLTMRVQSYVDSSIYIVVDIDQVMDCHSVLKWNRWQQALRENRSITTVTVKVKQLPQARMTEDPCLVVSLNKFFQSLATLPNMVQLKICGYCRGNDNGFPLDCITQLLTRATQLIKLHMTSVSFTTNSSDNSDGVLPIGPAAKQLSLAIARHPLLTELRFQDCRWGQSLLDDNNNDNDDSFFRFVFAGACAAPKMESLTIAPTFPQALGLISTRAIRSLQHAQSLHSLTLYKIENYFMVDNNDTGSSPFQVLTHLLASNKIPALQHLSTPFLASCRDQCQMMESVLLSNKSLLSLDLRGSHDPADTNMDTNTNSQQQHPLFPMALALCKAPCLQHFSLTGPGTTKLPLPLVQAFCQTVQLNYGLYEVTLYDIAVQKQSQAIVEYHCQLNQNGRKQWLHELYQNQNPSSMTTACRENPTTTMASNLIMAEQPTQQLLTFLSQLAGNQDAIYYYLSEINPSFLERMCRHNHS